MRVLMDKHSFLRSSTRCKFVMCAGPLCIEAVLEIVFKKWNAPEKSQIPPEP